MSERLTDDQVAWYAGTSRTAKSAIMDQLVVDE